MGGGSLIRTQRAIDTPFDNTSNGFTSQNVQGAIEEIGASASPGMSFGRNGGLLASTWLQNEGVPSNSAGRYVAIANPRVAQVAASSDTVSTYTITIYEHDGNSVNLNPLGTMTVTAARGGSANVNWPTSTGKQLAVRMTSGTSNNLIVALILKGNS